MLKTKFKTVLRVEQNLLGLSGLERSQRVNNKIK